jgi:hypothetical protein
MNIPACMHGKEENKSQGGKRIDFFSVEILYKTKQFIQK